MRRAISRSGIRSMRASSMTGRYSGLSSPSARRKRSERSSRRSPRLGETTDASTARFVEHQRAARLLAAEHLRDGKLRHQRLPRNPAALPHCRLKPAARVLARTVAGSDPALRTGSAARCRGTKVRCEDGRGRANAASRRPASFSRNRGRATSLGERKPAYLRQAVPSTFEGRRWTDLPAARVESDSSWPQGQGERSIATALRRAPPEVLRADLPPRARKGTRRCRRSIAPARLTSEGRRGGHPGAHRESRAFHHSGARAGVFLRRSGSPCARAPVPPR